MSRALHYYLSRDIVQDRYKKLHGGTLNAGKARSITVHLHQGIEFFKSAVNAPASIRPLLQFYGVSAVCRAVTLFLDPVAREATLTPAHGLEVVNWNNRTPLIQRLADLEIQPTGGLFKDLLKATKYESVFYANSSKPNWGMSHFSVPEGTVLRFGDVMGLMPDLWDEYNVWTKQKPVRVGLASAQIQETKLAIWKLNTTASDDLINSLFQDKQFKVIQKEEGSVFIQTSTEPIAQPVQLFDGPLGIPDVLLVPPLKSGVEMSTIGVLFIGAYVFSMLARYRLTDWLGMWNAEKGDAVRPFAYEFGELLQDRFMQLCADLLDTAAERKD